MHVLGVFKILCFVVSSFLINPRPPDDLLESGFAEKTRSPSISLNAHVGGTLKNPMFSSIRLSDKPWAKPL